MGAYAELDSLIALQTKARGFSLLHSQPAHSLLYGRRASHVRGRGLDFEELREYVAGDDVRSIDWRVTARTTRPYLRVYSEERDRPTMLVVDQRINMFFGSRVSMKSVVAAQIAALAAWRVFQQGDRVGAFVFNDTATEAVRIHRSRGNVLRILDVIARQNKALRGDSPARSTPARLNEVLRAVSGVCRHDALVVIASDFDGADAATRDLLLRLSQSNDVVCCFVFDPLAVKLPAADQLVVSDGQLQVELPLGRESARKSIASASDRRIQTILAWHKELGIPVLPISTAADVSRQLRHLLGQASFLRKRL
jgi:uncharacterized protein (DUF58 family)